MKPFALGLVLSFASLATALAPDGDTPAAKTGAPASEEAAPPAIGRGHIEKLAEREAALATLLSFLERGEEVPNYQVLLLSAPMPEEAAIEAAVTASIAKADALRDAARERARAAASAAAPPTTHPTEAGATEPALPPDTAGAETKAPLPPAIPTEKLVALGGLAAADILFETGREKEALPLYEAALAEKTGLAPYAAFRRARCLELLARDAEAIAAFEEAAKLAAGSPLAAQAAFAARHVAWKLSNAAALDAIGEGRKSK